MPKLSCLCGDVINLSLIPNPQGFKVMPETVVEDFIESLTQIHMQASSKEDFNKQAYFLFHLKTPGILQEYECPHCGRLAVFLRASDSIPILWYQVEKANTDASSIRSLTEQLRNEAK